MLKSSISTKTEEKQKVCNSIKKHHMKQVYFGQLKRGHHQLVFSLVVQLWLSSLSYYNCGFKTLIPHLV